MQFVQITRRKFSEDEFYAMIAELEKRRWENLLPPQLELEDLSSRRTESVVTSSGALIPACTSCGACCTFLFCVNVKLTDTVPSEMCWDVVLEVGKREIVVNRFLQREEKTLYCNALEGTAGEKVSCRIYAQRPLTCDLFEAGSDKCHALRRIYGYEPLLTPEELAAAKRKLKTRAAQKFSPETIKATNFVPQTGTGYLLIEVIMSDGSNQIVHSFNPEVESWTKFEFEGLTITQAKSLIESGIKGTQNNI